MPGLRYVSSLFFAATQVFLAFAHASAEVERSSAAQGSSATRAILCDVSPADVLLRSASLLFCFSSDVAPLSFARPGLRGSFRCAGGRGLNDAHELGRESE